MCALSIKMFGEKATVYHTCKPVNTAKLRGQVAVAAHSADIT